MRCSAFLGCEGGYFRPLSRLFWPCFGLVAAITTTALPSAAEPPSHAGEDPRAAPPGGVAPKQHFEEALVHYREGHYRAAVAELEAALTLDPTSKDLLYNLALVHEKLGQLETAVSVLERYAEIETDPKELERARQAIERMRGAQSEMGPPIVPPRVPMPPPAPPAPAPVPSESGTNHAWLVASAGLSVAAAVVGTIFGVRALVLRPGKSAATGAGTSAEQLRNEQVRAENSARIADVSFGISLVSGAGAAVLWLRDTSTCAHPTAARPPLGVTMQGSF